MAKVKSWGFFATESDRQTDRQYKNKMPLIPFRGHKNRNNNHIVYTDDILVKLKQNAYISSMRVGRFLKLLPPKQGGNDERSNKKSISARLYHTQLTSSESVCFSVI